MDDTAYEHRLPLCGRREAVADGVQFSSWPKARDGRAGLATQGGRQQTGMQPVVGARS